VFRAFEVRGRQELAQIDGFAALIRQLDADGVASGDHRDARRHRAHGACNVVGKANDARGFGAWRGLELIKRDHWSGTDIHDLAAHAEILEHALEQAGVLLEGVLGYYWTGVTTRLGQEA